MLPRSRLVVLAALATALTSTPLALAQEHRSLVALDLEGFGSRNLDAANRDLFTFGGGGAAHAELNVFSWLGLHAGGGVIVLPGDQSSEGTRWIGARAGLRLHWGVWATRRRDDGWLDAHWDYGVSGDITRSGFDVGLGYAVAVARSLRIGPFVRYQFGSDPRGEDPHLIHAGLTIGFLGDPRVVRDDASSPADADRDGVLDVDDVCPTEPMGASPDPHRHGCALRDQDGDGVSDHDDVCPTVPQGARPDPRRPGCPQSDADADGVADQDDVCPTVPQGARPDPQRAGCPITDQDSDGVIDAEDQCPTEPQGAHPDPQRRGCPVGDRDHDGITDDVDRCPEQPETYNGRDDADGCPDGESLGQRVADQIRITEQVRFRTNSDEIVGARSFAILDAVVAIMNANPDIALLDVQGHTDDRGSPEHNRDLSQRRAASVQRYLREHGVAPQRLSAHGFGKDRPLVTGRSRRARQANRRVEFHIVPQAAAGVSQ